MEAVFKWISELAPMEGMKYFAILCAILAILPYTNIIAKYLKQIVLRKKLEIVFFEYSYAQDIYVGKDENGSDIYMDLPSDDIFIIGSNLKLYWEVAGFSRIDITHVGEKLRGNAANVLIKEDISEYTLTAYGFWGEKTSTKIQIPKDKKHRIETTKLSTYSDYIIRSAPQIATSPITEYALSNSKFFENLRRMRNWYRDHLLKPINARIHCEKIVHADEKKKKIYKNIDAAWLTKGYTFTTKRYNNELIKKQIIK
jgi:hypothetical protein